MDANLNFSREHIRYSRFVQNGGRHQRKHSTLATAGNGEFKKWKCCGRIDSDPMGYCPAWNGLIGVGLKQNLQAHDSGGRQTLSPTKTTQAPLKAAWEEDEAPHTNADSRTGPAVVVVSRCSFVCLCVPLVSTGNLISFLLAHAQAQWDCASKTSLSSEENCCFVLHDCGGEGPHGEMYVRQHFCERYFLSSIFLSIYLYLCLSV